MNQIVEGSPKIELFTNGKIYSGFKGARITINFECLASDFELTCAYSAKNGDVQIASGFDVVIKINDQKVLTGYIDNVSHHISSDTREITVNGRSKTADLIDCSAGVLQIKNRDALSVATAICAPFGIKVIWDSKRPKTNITWKIEPGETCFEVLGKIARMNNLVLTTNADGDCVFTEPKNDDLGILTLGKELLEITTKDDHSQRFSEYICMGDSPSHKTSADGKKEDKWVNINTGAGGKSTALGKGRARTTVQDRHITRHRTRIILADDNATGQNTRERAEFERDRAIGQGRTIDVKVRGWTYPHYDEKTEQTTDRIWDVNKLLTVDAGLIEVDNEKLLIVIVQLIIDDNEGFIVLMTLAPPEGYSSMMYNEISKDEKRRKKKDKKDDKWVNIGNS